MEDPDQGDLGSDFEFGPGTDLVLSMLAFVIILLGLSREPIDTPTEPTIIPPLVENDAPETDNIVQLSDEMVAIFEPNAADVTPEGKRILSEKLATLAHAARNLNANVLRVQGYASPVPRPRGGFGGTLDGNLDLSAERSVNIAHAVHVMGVPYTCLAIEGYGRSRSTPFQPQPNKPPRTLEDWDAGLTSACRALPSDQKCADLVKKYEFAYAQDRRVDLVVAREPGSSCTAVQLLRYLDAAGRMPADPDPGPGSEEYP